MRVSYLAVIAALLPVAAQAQTVTPAPITRTTTTTISTGAAANFTAATYNYANTILFNNGVGPYGFTLDIQPGAAGIAFAGINGATVLPGTVPNGTTSSAEVATFLGNAGQGFTFGYTGGDQGFLTPTTIGGKYALTFSGGGTNLLDTGGTFTSTVNILGDWSAAASHTAATYGAGYTVLNNFTYAGGVTTFAVRTTNYQSVNPTISFSLLGSAVAAVPEPGTWAMMILGIGAVGFAMRTARRSDEKFTARIKRISEGATA